jgi:hypothetical protein
MKLATGTVVRGKVIFDGEALPEGTLVTVLGRDGAESFEVPPDLEHDLDLALAEAARGETLSAAEVVARLRAI